MRPDPASDSSRLPPGWLERPDTQALVLRELAARRKRRLRRFIAVTAAAAAVAVLGVFAARPWQPAAASAPTLASLPAPGREILPDGSIIVRRGPAEITVTYGADARRITLARGTAHFDVARDPARPFIVTAAGVTVRAVGTAFSVGVGSGEVEVLVTEGRVAVAEADVAEPMPPALVEAGRGVIVERRATPAEAPRSVRDVPSTDLEARLAWRVRILDFSQTPLDVVVRQLNAHNRVQFALGDPALAGVRLSGLIRADRIDGVIHLLEQDCGVQAERVDDSTILLRPR
jgi:transmembrane sensor